MRSNAASGPEIDISGLIQFGDSYFSNGRRTEGHDQVTYTFGERIPQPAEAIAVADGVWWIRMPLPFALDHINLWVLRDGEGFTLVDTGGISRISSRMTSMTSGFSAAPMQGPAMHLPLNGS